LDGVLHDKILKGMAPTNIWKKFLQELKHLKAKTLPSGEWISITQNDQ